MNIESNSKGAARVMHEDYNKNVSAWVNESFVSVLPELVNCINKLYE